MGLFHFIKEAGEKLFGDHEDDKAVAQKIAETVNKLNLGVQGLDIQKQGDKLVLNGQAQSQEALEKAILAAGNHLGIGQVESNIELAQAQGQTGQQGQTEQASQPQQQASQPQLQPVFYTVKSGDTLSKISKEQYGDANRYNEIFEANKPMLTSPDKIYPGQQLRIPQGMQQKKAA